MAKVEIEINGQKVQADKGAMIIQCADEANMHIPRFCYHKKLTIAANCRMCLVEVAGSRKPLPACATPVAEGMKIFTQSKVAIDAQRSVMEFLLINHPLDCPICDQGGECELQDTSMGYGGDLSRYTQGKRVVKDKDIGPLVQTDMTRCIQCTRCVRFGTEIAGHRELGGVNRGEHMEITTYIEHSLESELSGNIIDLCPVGALTNKPFRYSARAWELEQHATIAPHDCVGSHLFAHSKNGKLKRVVPRECESVNEMWISDRDRYSCFGLYHPDRVAQPQIKLDGNWQTVDWDTALTLVKDSLQKVIDEQGAEKIGGLLSPSSTTEEAFLFQKLLRGLGSENIDHRLRQQDFADDDCQPAYPGLTPNLQVSDLASMKTAVVIGSQLRKEQPLINHRLRQAALKGGKIYFINPLAANHNFAVAGEMVNVELVAEVASLAAAVAELTNQNLPASWKDVITRAKITEQHREIVKQLQAHPEKSILILGGLALHHPQASILRGLAAWMVKQINIHGCGLTEGSNSAGAWLAGAVPHRLPAAMANKKAGLNAIEMLEKPRAAYLLLGNEPEFDTANSNLAIQALHKAECVIALTAFTTSHMLQYADVILPIAPFAETSGSYINMAGQCLEFKGVAQPFGESRPAWKVLRVLGNLFNLSGFDYMTSKDVMMEVKSACENLSNTNLKDPAELTFIYKNAPDLMRIAETPLYSVDSLVRRSEPLQQTPEAHTYIRINPKLAAELNMQNDDLVCAAQDKHKVRLPVKLDERVPMGVVCLPAAIDAAVGMGSNFSAIELSRGI